MSLSQGTRLGPFEVTAPLGADGMGEVFRARDTRLEREVAVKVLSAEFAADTDRRTRFEQEARAARLDIETGKREVWKDPLPADPAGVE